MLCVHLHVDYTPEGSTEAGQVQTVVSSLYVLEVIAPVLATPDVPRTLMPLLLPALHSPFTSIRHMAARGVAGLCNIDLHYTLEVCVTVCKFLYTVVDLFAISYLWSVHSIFLPLTTPPPPPPHTHTPLPIFFCCL